MPYYILYTFGIRIIEGVFLILLGVVSWSLGSWYFSGNDF